ncbi:MAG: LytTR family DNA-binding domain-containing protein [Bacteroidetes bacterium]|nr:LytTR family DNA-binding domain-containing protein [Bacteroidota bacterium]MCL6101894.1 LytTR family DNA-binding domain-containing protein [Bacteroidota bacterium]
MVSSVIIDDDNISRMVLREILKNTPENVELLGEAGSVGEGVLLIERVHPDLVFLDISMPDGTGFDLLDKIKKIDFKIIFITAYSEYAIKAFKYSAFDYIVKPINIEELAKAISRIPKIRKVENKIAVNELKTNLLSNGENGSKTIALPDLNGFAIIEVDKILRCEGLRNYTRIIFKDEGEKVVSRTLLEFENLLTPLGFIRIHRSHLVNLANVVRYIKANGGLVELKTGVQLKVSPKYKDDLLHKLLYNKL